MANTNGTIQVGVDIDVVFGDVIANQKQLDEKILAVTSKYKELKVPVKVAPELEIAKRDIDAQVANVRKVYEGSLGQVQLSLGIADKLNKELDNAGAIMGKKGTVLAKELKSLLQNALKEAGKSSSLAENGDVIGNLLSLQGKSKDAAKAQMEAFIKDSNSQAERLKAINKSLMDDLARKSADITAALARAEKQAARIREASVGADAAKGRTEAYTGDNEKYRLKLLQEQYAALRKLDDAEGNLERTRSTNFLRDLGEQGKIVEGLDKRTRAIDQINAAQSRVASEETSSVAAQIAARNQLIEIYKRTSQVMQGAYDEERRTQEVKVQDLQRSKAGAEALASAYKAVLETAKNARAAEANGGEAYLAMLRQHKAALLDLAKLKGEGFDKANAVGKLIENYNEYRVAVEKVTAATRELKAATAANSQGKTPTAESLFAELDARKNLIALMEKYAGVYGSTAAATIAHQREILATLAPQLKALEDIQAAELRVKSAVETTAQAQAAGGEIYVKALRDQYVAQYALDNLRKSGFSDSNLVLKRIQDHKDETRVLELEAKELANVTNAFHNFESAQASLRVGKLDMSQLTSARTAINELDAALKSATKVQADFTDDGVRRLAALRESFKGAEAEVKTLMELTAQELKLNTAGNNASNAINDQIKLKYLNEQIKAIQEIINLRSREELSGLKGNQSFIENAKAAGKALQEQAQAISRNIAEVNRLNSSYTTMSNAFRSFIRYGVEMAAFYKAQQAIGDVTKSVVDLEDALKAVQAISRSTDAEMTGVAAAVKRVAIDTEFSTNQIAEAAQTLAQAGVEIQKVGEALDATAKFASASGTGLQTSADLMTTMSNVFKDLSFGQIADQMTATINLSKLTGDELSTVLSRAVEVSDTFHIMPEQMNAAFAVLRNAGIKASTISTGYRQALLEVFSPDEKTLSFLQKRYAEIGKSLSKGDIANMFQGFAHSADPIRAAAQELDKLGYSTSAASEWARVYDVRATNVLNVLVKQRGEYVKLTTQIGESGAATKGATTQLEALGKSWDNLGSVITAVAADIAGPGLSSLEKMVDKFADLVQWSGEAINSMRRVSGETGVMSATLTGLFRGIGTWLGSGSIAKGLGAGVGFASLSSFLQTTLSNIGIKISDGVGEMAGRAVEIVSTYFSAKYLLGKMGVMESLKKAMDVAKIDAVTRKANEAAGAEVASIMQTFVGGIANMLAGLKNSFVTAFPRVAAFMANPIVAGAAIAGTALFASYQIFRKSVDDQILAVENDLERTTKTIKDAEEKIANQDRNKIKVDGISDNLNRVSADIEGFFKANFDGTKIDADAVSKAVDELSKVSTDLGSSALVGQLDKLKGTLGNALGGTVNLDALIAKVNESAAVIDQVEGTRLSLQQRLLESFEAYGKTGKKDDLILAYQKLGAVEQANISNQITSISEAKRFFEGNKNFAELMDQQVYKTLKDAETQKAKLEREKVDLIIQKSLEDTNGYSGTYSQMLQATKDGNLALLEKYREEIKRSAEYEAKPFIAKVGLWFEGIYDTIVNALHKLTPEDLQAGWLGFHVINPNRKQAAKKEADIQVSAAQADEFAKAQERSIVDNKASGAAKAKAEFSTNITNTLDMVKQGGSNELKAQVNVPETTATSQRNSSLQTEADLPTAWREVYFQATQMGKTAQQQVDYLKQSSKSMGGLPPVLQEVLNEANHELDSRRESNKYFVKAQEEARNVETSLSVLAQERLDLSETSRKLDQEYDVLSRDKVNNADKLKENLAARLRVMDRTTELDTKEEALKKQALVAQQNLTNEANKVGVKVVEQSETLKQVNNAYRAHKLIYEADAARAHNLEKERSQAIADGNAQLIKNSGIDAEIYNLKTREAISARDMAEKSLLSSEALRRSMAGQAMTLDNVTAYFKTLKGQDFLAANQIEAKHAEELARTMEVMRQALEEQISRIGEDAKVAAEQKAGRALDKVALEQQVATHTASQENLNNPAQAAAELTRITLEESQKRIAIRKEETADQLKGYQEEAEFARSKGIDELDVMKGLATSKRQVLEGELAVHKETLNTMFAAEQQHAAAVRALKEELLSTERSDAQFKREIQKEFMADADKMEFDRVNAARDASSAIQQIKQGDYEHGKRLLDEAISEQQAYVKEMAAAEKAGEVAIGSTQAAMASLNGMTNQRNEAIKAQMKIQEEARVAAKAAADAELLAIKNLTNQIEALVKALGGIPALDIGDTSGKVAAVESLTAAVKATGDAAVQAKAELDAMTGPSDTTSAANLALPPEKRNVSIGLPAGVPDNIQKTVDENGKVTYANKEFKPTNQPDVTKTYDANGKVTGITAVNSQANQAAGNEVQISTDQAEAKVEKLKEDIANVAVPPAAGPTDQGPAKQEIELGIDQALATVQTLKDAIDKALGIGQKDQNGNAAAAPEIKVSVEEATKAVDTLKGAIDKALGNIEVKDKQGPQGLTLKLNVDDAQKAVDKLVEELNKSMGTEEKPKQVKIAMDDAQKVLDKLAEAVKTALDAMQDKTITVSVNDQASQVLQQIKSELDAIQDKTITVTTVHADQGGGGGGDQSVNLTPSSPGPITAATGGLVRGPGTGTSDSIPAMLSDGEYVMPADAVAKVGKPFLDKIRGGSDIKHYAKGGPVGEADTRPLDPNDLSFANKKGPGWDWVGEILYPFGGDQQVVNQIEAQWRTAATMFGKQLVKSGNVSGSGADQVHEYYMLDPKAIEAELTKASAAKRQKMIEATKLLTDAAMQGDPLAKNPTVTTNGNPALRTTFDQSLKLPGTSGGSGPEFAPSLKPAPSLANPPVGGLLKGMDVGTIPAATPTDQQKHLIEIRNGETGANAFVHADQRNVGELLSVLKNLQGVSL